MDISAATWWWIATGVLVGVELVTGTFYLLMIALGTACAALVAHAGLGVDAQMIATAVVGGGATLVWHFKRSRTTDVGDRLETRDVSLDVGERVHVTQWQADGHAQVQFRGATWQARLEGTGDAKPGEHIIVALEGNRLMLRPS
jgi:membrane protein implicated in regulation of membrane protease activity